MHCLVASMRSVKLVSVKLVSVKLFSVELMAIMLHGNPLPLRISRNEPLFTGLTYMRLEFKKNPFIGWAQPTGFVQKVGTAHPTDLF